MIRIELVYRLPPTLRFDFARPRGLIIKGDFTKIIPGNLPSIACIGDVVSRYCINWAGPHVRSIVVLVLDGSTRREKLGTYPNLQGYTIIKTSNPRGTVAAGAARRLCSALRGSHGSRVALIVSGEEDMLALPAISCSMLGGLVVYGVPGIGAALIRVSRATRWEASGRLLLLRPSSADV